MKKNINKTESLDEQCIICGSWSNLIISAKIREKNHNVLKCEDCGFVFLSNYEELDYSNNYKSLVFIEGMSREEQIIMRSGTLQRFNQIVSELCLVRTKNVKILEIGSGGGGIYIRLKKISSKFKNRLY
jgi:hypothetical protein